MNPSFNPEELIWLGKLSEFISTKPETLEFQENISIAQIRDYGSRICITPDIANLMCKVI
jgi:hypothetical protein